MQYFNAFCLTDATLVLLLIAMKREPQERFQRLIGERIRFAREQAHLNQKQLADRLGFKDRQILSNIESGQRRVSAEELLLLIRELGRSVEFFSDPFLLLGEVVSWRAQNYPKLLADFENRLLPAVGLYRHLSAGAQEDEQLFVPQLPLTKASYYEDAAYAAQRLVEQWNLGTIPSKTLAEAAERRLNLLVMMVDAPREISGAAIFLPELVAIVVNRNEPLGRRNYDFAHELFHLLTWQSMPPAHLDQETATKKAGGKRIEQLADTFAAALLMPESSIEPLWNLQKEIDVHDWLNQTARVFGVTAIALYWRLRSLKYLTPTDSIDIQEERLVWNGAGPEAEGQKPKLYSRKFVEQLHSGLDNRDVAERRVTQVLNCTGEDLEELFRDYGLEPPVDL
jgi:XRE family transcriptional regulator, fatty acid utilization regulator